MNAAHARPLSERRPERADAPAAERRAATSEPRRVVAVIASALVPGLGQVVNGRHRLARWFALPILLVIAAVVLVLATRSGPRLLAWALDPQVMTLLLAANLVVLGWRMAAVLQAFFDGRYRRRPGIGTSLAAILVVLAVAVPHGILNTWGTHAQQAFSDVFTGGSQSVEGLVSSGPDDGARVNVLLIGVDSRPDRSATLTDSIMVASIDPIRPTVSLASLPRDLVRVPIGGGEVYLPKLNSLLGYANRHPDEFPNGGIEALKNAVGELLGIEIHYYVKIDFFGFAKLIDALGGIDVNVKRGFYDAEYDRMGIRGTWKRGWGVEPGVHHFWGFQALAYARSRKAVGESDYTRAARQQEILLAIRDKIMADGSLLMKVPELLDAFGDVIETDIPTSRLPHLAAVADELSESSIYRMVISKPLVKGGKDPTYGSVQVPNVGAIQVAAAALFPAPGELPSTPSKGPAASSAPADDAQAAR